jgi:hypothetical protein
MHIHDDVKVCQRTMLSMKEKLLYASSDGPARARRSIHNGRDPWCVYLFARQLDAMMYWGRFEGRGWLESEFVFPERPDNIPVMNEPERPRILRRKPPDRRRYARLALSRKGGSPIWQT